MGVYVNNAYDTINEANDGNWDINGVLQFLESRIKTLEATLASNKGRSSLDAQSRDISEALNMLRNERNNFY